ncbi:HNH endonuclease signature motif containing protein [Enterovirga rhinocerotis]|uniref:HNH nuclease domain-containing protein n=1 Tax=Enterovirga rhinocerotis TaxID=1339210 RepID=A0A4R7BZU9_9HYPH|nr:HNH endonuclease signature motif containing protein [Enterovirga rhinocerotis]TDR90305.1 hypothetical protein EV668_3151 [Enterovirga rhinocerotis]
MARLRPSGSRLTASAPRLTPSTPRLAASPKVADAIYRTPEHRRWSAAVIRRARGKCQWPEGCDKAAPRDRMVADHIVEVKDGGNPFDPANGQCLCVQHNTLKGARARLARQRS